MVRIYPGSKSGGDLKRRGIITTTIGNDIAYYRNSIQHLDNDPRIKSTEFEKTQKDLIAVNKIWNNRPECWKDHFKRSFKDYEFGAKLGEKRTKRLTGYNLYFQLMLDSFHLDRNHFYDPPCFCLQPIDCLGEIIHSYGNFKYYAGKRVKYKFDEIQKLQIYAGCGWVRDNPFVSAAFSQAPAGQVFYMSIPWAYPRAFSPGVISFEWADMYNLVFWPPLCLSEKPDSPVPGGFLWDCCAWVYHGPGICDCPLGVEPLKCIKGYYVGAAPRETQCMRAEVKFVIKYGLGGAALKITATDAPPYRYVWWGEELIAIIGCGYGNPIEVESSLGYWPPDSNPLNSMLPWEKSDPCPVGETDCNNPYGEIVGTSGHAYQWHGEYPDCKTGHYVDMIWSLSRTVKGSVQDHSPEFRVIVNEPEYDGRGFQNWCPWGGIKTYVSENGKDWIRTFLGNYNTCVSPGKVEYCFDNRWANTDIKWVKVIIQNTTAWPCCTRTFPVGLSVLDRIPPKNPFETEEGD